MPDSHILCLITWYRYSKNVEDLGPIIGKSIEKGIIINIPMGQGQEDRTNKRLEECVKEGKMDLVNYKTFT